MDDKCADYDDGVSRKWKRGIEKDCAWYRDHELAIARQPASEKTPLRLEANHMYASNAVMSSVTVYIHKVRSC
jgi:hypothetical protein